MAKYKKINWDKCNEDYKNVMHGICFNYSLDKTCSVNKKKCIAYKKWDKSDGKF